jgi:hypothetical protein
MTTERDSPLLTEQGSWMGVVLATMILAAIVFAIYVVVY